MLVTFSTPAYADITMFGEVAVRFLELMGHSGTVPGALLAEDVGTALRRLEAAVAAYEEQVPSQSAEEEEDEARVSLPTRALPLIELLRAAENEKVDVMWVENT
jgi:hypothetical protein